MDNTKCSRACGTTGALIYCLWECKIAITLENTLAFLTKLNIYLSFDPVFSPRYLLKRNESIHPHKDPHMNVHCGFICNRQKLETQMSINMWVDKKL